MLIQEINLVEIKQIIVLKQSQPWAKTNKGKWTDIKISDPSLEDLEVSNLFDTYEEAKYVCDNCCAQNATIVSIN